MGGLFFIFNSSDLTNNFHPGLNNRLGINSQANSLSTLKRTKTLIQSDLSDFAYEPGILIQAGLQGLLIMVQVVS